MKRILKEPLLHFLVLGALLFAVYGVLNRSAAPAPESRRIVVSQGQVASMMESFTRTWQRPPTAQELDGLIRDRVREEVYCREAMVLGLDRDDSVIRRRLRQKMEFILDDVSAQVPPSDAELDAYLQAHPDWFRVNRLFTFRHAYLNPAKHGENLARDTAQLLAELNKAASNPTVAAMGDPFLLDDHFTAVPAGEIAGQFGDKFAVKLGEIPTGQWQGPVQSAFGVHLVFISQRTEGRLPPLAEVREAVRREWGNTRVVDANEKIYQEMLKRYTVTIEPPAEVVKKIAAIR